MKTDIEIARECKLSNIQDVAKYAGIPVEELEMHGKYIAKVPDSLIDPDKVAKSNLILVTAITRDTPAAMCCCSMPATFFRVHPILICSMDGSKSKRTT